MLATHWHQVDVKQKSIASLAFLGELQALEQQTLLLTDSIRNLSIGILRVVHEQVWGEKVMLLAWIFYIDWQPTPHTQSLYKQGKPDETLKLLYDLLLEKLMSYHGWIFRDRWICHNHVSTFRVACHCANFFWIFSDRRVSFLIWEFDECPCLLLFSLALCPQYIFLYSIHTKSIFLMTLPVFTAIWLIKTQIPNIEMM